MCFYSGRIRTLVAMATYIFHRLVLGKVKKKISVSIGIFGIYFLKKCLLSGHLRFTGYALVQIAEFDRLPGRQKG